MSYQRPQDTYIHSNASEFDARYQPGAYQDDPRQTAGDYYRNTDSPYKQESQYEMEPQGTYGQYPNQQGAYKDYSSSHQNLAGPGGAPGEFFKYYGMQIGEWSKAARNNCVMLCISALILWITLRCIEESRFALLSLATEADMFLSFFFSFGSTQPPMRKSTRMHLPRSQCQSGSSLVSHFSSWSFLELVLVPVWELA